MSYDLMAFNKDEAPNNRKQFMKWYEQQTQWEEKHSYDDPKNTSKELNSFFIDIIKQFPAMNGPFSSTNLDTQKATNYSIGNNIIYASFAWSVADKAYKEMLKKSKDNNVGFFDVSSDKGAILFPNERKILIPIEKLGTTKIISIR